LSFRRVVLLLILTALLGFGIVYAIKYEFTQTTSTSAPTLTRTQGVNEQAGLKLTLTLDKTEYALGEPINITLTVTNISNQTIDFSDFVSWWDFVVYNGTSSGYNGLFQWLHSGITFPFHGTEIPLDTGMGLTNEAMVWSQMCNATVDRYGTPISPVSLGTYYIVGMYNNFGWDWNYNLVTSPIQITIA